MDSICRPSADVGVAESWRRWNRRAIVGLSAVASLLPAINVAIDPFDLFGATPLGDGPYANQRLHHANRLSSKASAVPDVVIFGDSIIGINDPRQLLEYTNYESAYNASVFMASASDIRHLSEFISRLERKPKLVVVGLDAYMFSGQPRPDSYSIKMPADVTGQPYVSWWTQALFAPSIASALDKLMEKIEGKPSVVYDRILGHYTRPQLDAQIAAAPNEYAKRAFDGVQPSTSEIRLASSELEAIAGAARVLSVAGIPAVWVLQPPSYGLKLIYGQTCVHTNAAAIAGALSGQWLVDLTRMNSVSDDPLAYYDLKHYTPAAGRAILAMVAAEIRIRGSRVPAVALTKQ